MTQGIDFGALLKGMGTQLEVIPIGDYDVVVKQADAGMTNDGSKPRIKVKFAVENGPHAGRTLWNQFTISPENPQALLIFFTQMKALGLDAAFWSQQGVTAEHAAQALVGKRARVNVGHRAYNGAPQPDIKRINPPLGAAGGLPGVPGPAPVTPGGLGAPTPVAAVPAPVAPAPSVVPPPVAPPAPPAPVAPEIVQTTVVDAVATGNVPGTEQVESPVVPAPPQPEVPQPTAPEPAPPEPPQAVAPAAPDVAPAPPVPAPQQPAQAPVAPAATAGPSGPPPSVPF